MVFQVEMLFAVFMRPNWEFRGSALKFRRLRKIAISRECDGCVKMFAVQHLLFMC